MTHRRRPWPSANLPSPPAASSKPSLDGILCTSLVALTNKHRLHYDALTQELYIPGCMMANTVSTADGDNDLILVSPAGRGSTGSSLAAPLLTLGGLQCSSSW